MAGRQDNTEWRFWLLLWLFLLGVNSCEMADSLDGIEDALDRVAPKVLSETVDAVNE